jgi:hypothetical protein
MSIEPRTEDATPSSNPVNPADPVGAVDRAGREPDEPSTDSHSRGRKRRILARRVREEARRMSRLRRRGSKDDGESSGTESGRQSRRSSHQALQHEAGGFGMRRPLRYLSHKLDLDDKQTSNLSRILEDLKIERAQAAVDDQRVTAALAKAVDAETFDAEAALEAAQQRVKATERLQRAAVKALGELHGMLDEDQREALAYLVRSGVLTV